MSLPTNLPQSAHIQGFWRMEEESGTRSDLSDNSNDLSDINTVGYGTGKIGNAASFVGGNSERLQRDSGDCVGINSEPFTALCWIKASTSGIIYVIGGSSGTNRGIRISSGHLQLMKPGTLVGSSAGTIGNNILTHIAVSYDGSDYALYINGSGDGSGTNEVALNYGNFYLAVTSGESYSTLYIDELLIYDTILTSGEVSDVYAITSYSYASAFIPKIIVI